MIETDFHRYVLEMLGRMAKALEQIAENTKPEEDEKAGKHVKGFGL